MSRSLHSLLGSTKSHCHTQKCKASCVNTTQARYQSCRPTTASAKVSPGPFPALSQPERSRAITPNQKQQIYRNFKSTLAIALASLFDPLPSQSLTSLSGSLSFPGLSRVFMHVFYLFLYLLSLFLLRSLFYLSLCFLFSGDMPFDLAPW